MFNINKISFGSLYIGVPVKNTNFKYFTYLTNVYNDFDIFLSDFTSVLMRIL